MNKKPEVVCKCPVMECFACRKKVALDVLKDAVEEFTRRTNSTPRYGKDASNAENVLHEGWLEVYVDEELRKKE